MEVLALDLDDGAGGIPTLQVDLADVAALKLMGEEALSVLGQCDILVNCAGICESTPLEGPGLERYHHVLAVNLHAPVHLMQLLAPDMARRGYGRIVNVTSVHSHLSERGYLAYEVSKAGLEAATRSVAVELAHKGVMVNAVAPGFVRTRMAVVDGNDELESEWFKSFYVDGGRLPAGRAARPREVAELVRWLVGEANSYVTGEVVRVDGGLSATF